MTEETTGPGKGPAEGGGSLPVPRQAAEAAVLESGGRQLTAEERARVEELRQSLDIDDPQAVIQFGLPAQNKIASFADTLLQEVREKDADQARQALEDLLSRVRELDVEGLAKSEQPSRLPLVGRLVDRFKRFDSRYEKISGSVEKLLTGLERTRMGLLRDVTGLEKMYELNLEHLRQLDLYIAAGEKVREDLETRHLPKLADEAHRTGDPLAAQRLADRRQAATRFERRLHDLRLTRMMAIQTAPQIRLLQGNDQSLVEKIQSSITNTIPLWKSQIVIALSLYRQQRAMEVQRSVTDASNELLEQNAELLRTGSANVAREAERGIVDLETLQKVNEDLIATLEESLQIQEEGHARRLAAEVELAKLQSELKQRLLAMKGGRALGLPAQDDG